MSHKRKLLIIASIIVLTIFGGAFFLWSKGTNLKSSQKQEIIISEQKAREVAGQNLGAFEFWKEPKLSDSYTFNDLSNTPSAYLFTVVDLYGRAGFITVSASTRFTPIIQSETENTTPVTNMLAVRNELVRGTKYEPNDVKTELLYLGGTDYFGKFTFRESGDADVKYFFLNYGSPTQVTIDLLEAKQRFYNEYSDDVIFLLWEQYNL